MLKRRIMLIFVILISCFNIVPVLADNTTIINGNGATIINGNVTINNFSDIKNDYWAYDAISSMKTRGVINGYEDGSFKPQNSITREEFASLITKTFSLDTTVTKEVYYSDVQPDRWSFKDINASKDFLTGYYPPKGKAFFDPEAKATREDVAVALVKSLSLSTKDSSMGALKLTFKDYNQISPSLRSYIDTATVNNLISGYEDGTFRPQQQITRAEVTTLLYRSIKNSSGDNTNAPVSVPQVKPIQPTIQPTPSPILNQPAANQGPTTVQPKTINPPDLWADVIRIPGDPVTVRITGETTPDAQVYIDGEKINLDYTGTKFTVDKKIAKEGTYQYVIKSSYFNQVSTVTKSIDVNIDAPQLTLDSNPVVMRYSPNILVEFSILDTNDNYPVLYVNGQKRSYKDRRSGAIPVSTYNGKIDNAYLELNLTQNGENDFTFKVINKYGKESNTVTKAVYYTP